MMQERRLRSCSEVAKQCAKLAQHAGRCASLCKQSLVHAAKASSLVSYPAPACTSATAETHALMYDAADCVRDVAQDLVVAGVLLAPPILAFATELLARHQKHLQGTAPPMPQQRQQVSARAFSLFRCLLSSIQAAAASNNKRMQQVAAAAERHTQSEATELQELRNQDIFKEAKARQQQQDNDSVTNGRARRMEHTSAGGKVCLGLGLLGLALLGCWWMVDKFSSAADDNVKSSGEAYEEAHRVSDLQERYTAKNTVVLFLMDHHVPALTELLTPVEPDAASTIHSHGAAVLPSQLLQLLHKVQVVHDSMCALQQQQASSSSPIQRVSAAEILSSAGTGTAYGTGTAAEEAEFVKLALANSLGFAAWAVRQLRKYQWPEITSACLGAWSTCGAAGSEAGVGCAAGLLQPFLQKHKGSFEQQVYEQVGCSITPAAVQQLLQDMRPAEGSRSSVLECLMEVL